MKLLFDKNKKYDISIIGRATLDLNPTDYYNTLDKNKNFNLYVGGSAANIAIGLARFNKKVNFISRVSNDNLGKVVLNFFEKENLETNQIQLDNERNIGLTFTEMLNEVSSNILMYRENVADLAINDNEIDIKKIQNSKFALISAVSLSTRNSSNACKLVAHIAKENNVNLIFDLDYRPYTWGSREQICKEYKYIAKQAEILIGSQEEFEFLFETESENYNFEQLFKEYLTEHNAKIIIFKQGSKGSILYTSNSKITIGIIKVKLLKGFGGGDAFASAFINALLEEKELIEALLLATVSASMVVSSLSSSEALPNMKELNNFLEKTTPEYGPIVEKF